MAPNPKSFLRRLGYMEMYHSNMHNADHYCSTIVTCRYALPPSLAGFEKHKRVVQRFDTAVAQAVIQFPLLQVGLVGEGTRKPAWVSLPSVDLAAHIVWDIRADSTNYDQDFETNLGYQLDTKFDHLETQPSWRLLLMRTETDNFVDAMFVWNHTNIDANTLEESFRGFHFKSARPRLKGHDDRHIQEKLAKHRLTAGFAFSEIWHHFGPSPFLSSTAKATWAPIHPIPYVTRCKCTEIDPVTLKQLLNLCRQHETTLTAVMHGIVLACLSVIIPEGQVDAFKVATSMDQRRFMCQEVRPSKYVDLNPENSVQNCVGSIYHIFKQETVSDIRAQARVNTWASQPINDLEPSIWKAAKKIRCDIQDRINLGLTDSVVSLMKPVTDWQDYHKSTLKKPRELSWDVTNIGVMDSKTEGGGSKEDAWSVTKARLILCDDVAGPAIQISMVSAKGGSLSVDISWQDLDELNDIGNRLVQDVRSWLMYLGS